MNKKSFIKFQCVTALAITLVSPVLSVSQSVFAAETSSTAAVSDQTLNTNFTSKSDQTALFRISKTGDQSLQIRKIEIVDAKTGESQRVFTESIISKDMTLKDDSIVGSIDAQKGRSYTIKIFYDKSDLKSKEATLTSAVLLKDGSTSSSAKRFNSKADLDKLQDEALAILKDKSVEIEKTKETVPKSENKSDSSTSQNARTSSKPLPKPKDVDSDKSNSTSDPSNQKTSSSDKKNQSADDKNEPNRVAKSIDSKNSNQSQSSSKSDTSKLLEEVLQMSERLLARQVNTSNVSEAGMKDLEQSKSNLAERVERYKLLVKSEKADEKSVNVAIEDLKAAAGHYSLLLDLKSAVDSTNSKNSESKNDVVSNQSKDSKDSKSKNDAVSNQSKDSKDSKDSKESKDHKESKDQKDSKDSKDLKDSKDKNLTKSEQSKSARTSDNSQVQGKTPRKFADTGEKDSLILSILGAIGLTSIFGSIYKKSRKN